MKNKYDISLFLLAMGLAVAFVVAASSFAGALDN
jgi:hypothetical protein